MVHIRFEGKSYEFTRRQLRLVDDASDREVVERVARVLDVRTDCLRGHVVDRPATGALIVRPEAVYG